MPPSSRHESQPAPPYLLRSVLANVPLAEDEDHHDTHITCVEFWNDNLYIGTSSAEILHFVSIPSDPSDQSAEAQFILASRLQPAVSGVTSASSPGVQQILVLPEAGRACILCNHTLTFYSLPELSPAYDGSFKLGNVAWVGGVDLNGPGEEEPEDSSTIMICQRNRIRLVRVDGGSKPVSVRDVELGGCVTTSRRGDIACAADSKSYSLVDVVARQAIPLFEIASAGRPVAVADESGDDNEPPPPPPPKDDVPETSTENEAENDESKDPPVKTEGDSTGEQNFPERRSSVTPSTEPISEAPKTHTAGKASVDTTKSAKKGLRSSTKHSVDLSHRQIRPNVVSPSDTEFLLTTGTSFREAGVGMFVNLDGDVSRPTIEFSRYPHMVALDGPLVGNQPEATVPGGGIDSNLVLAVIDVSNDISRDMVIEVQDLDAAQEDADASRSTVRVPRDSAETAKHSHLGLRSSLTTRQLVLTEIIDKLRVAPLDLMNAPAAASDSSSAQIIAREQSETEFVARLSNAVSNLLVWSKGSIWTAVRAPMVLHFDGLLQHSLDVSKDTVNGFADANIVRQTLFELHGREPTTELEFISTNYLRQKGSLILFLDLLARTLSGEQAPEQALQLNETSLIAGEVDPRLLLAVIPLLQSDIFLEDSSVWVSQGLFPVLHTFKERFASSLTEKSTALLEPRILPLLKRYLIFWRQKKGFGSVADEKNLFKTVDCALLHTLLILDDKTPRGPATPGSIRRELNALVDKGVDCFEEAITLLERYKRLYVLSRLYQSRKMTRSVLQAWQRILDGEADADFVDPEEKMQGYLVQIRDRGIVEHYGGWLANRNPEVGIRVFTESAKVRFTPDETLEILRDKAPGTVRRLLEHLVFDKHQAQYANNLISYYLDAVLDALAASPTARDALRDTYRAYRALRPPKPTYSQFIASTPSPEPWWAHRSRLLQLLAGSHGAASSYDVPMILARIEPYANELVPETIILGGRQGRHREAVRLLTHSLGDYDTAIRYCVRAGSGTSQAPAPGEGAAALSTDEQRALFGQLLVEFLAIEDRDARLEQVGGLLERHAGWFDVGAVLDMVPEEWSVEVLAGFLEGSLRELVSARHESAVVRGLAGAVQLDVSAGLVEKVGVGGVRVDAPPVEAD